MPTPSARSPQHGFTLLEILVSLAVIGFLLAMISPRLAGTGREAATTLTQTNMDRLVDLITVDLQKGGKYPTGMTNIVSVDDGTGIFHKPVISDQDPDTGYDVLSFNMDQRHRFFLHYLRPAETAELRALGAVHVYNCNSPFDRNVAPASPSMQPVDAGVAVLMTAGGDSDGKGMPAAATLATAARREVNACAAQSKAFFTVDSEGAETQTVDVTGWGIDFYADGDIN